MQLQSFVLRLDDKKPLDLARLNGFLEQVTPLQVTGALIPGPRPAWSVLVMYEGEAPLDTEPVAPPEEPLEEDPLFQALRQWRSEKARQEGVKPYLVAHNSELIEIARLRPLTAEALEAIKGFGPRKVERYGREVLEVIRQTVPAVTATG